MNGALDTCADFQPRAHWPRLRDSDRNPHVSCESVSVCSEALSMLVLVASRRRLFHLLCTALFACFVMEKCAATGHASNIFFRFSFSNRVSSSSSSAGSGLPLAGFSPRGGLGSSQSLRDPTARGNNSFPSCAISWSSNRLTLMSEAGTFSRSSESAMSRSPDHPHPARDTSSHEDTGKHLPAKLTQLGTGSRSDGLVILAPNEVEGPSHVTAIVSHTLSCHRPFCRARCASSNNIPSQCPYHSLFGWPTSIRRCRCPFFYLSNSSSRDAVGF